MIKQQGQHKVAIFTRFPHNPHLGRYLLKDISCLWKCLPTNNLYRHWWQSWGNKLVSVVKHLTNSSTHTTRYKSATRLEVTLHDKSWSHSPEEDEQVRRGKEKKRMLSHRLYWTITLERCHKNSKLLMLWKFLECSDNNKAQGCEKRKRRSSTNPRPCRCRVSRITPLTGDSLSPRQSASSAVTRIASWSSAMLVPCCKEKMRH